MTARLSLYLVETCLEINRILPNRIVIAMVDADAFNGTYTKNPFNFKNYDTTTMGLTVNRENLPGKPLQPKFGQENNYISTSQTLFSGTSKMFDNQGNGITREQEGNGYHTVCV